jgi:hypothetical protein
MTAGIHNRETQGPAEKAAGTRSRNALRSSSASTRSAIAQHPALMWQCQPSAPSSLSCISGMSSLGSRIQFSCGEAVFFQGRTIQHPSSSAEKNEFAQFGGNPTQGAYPRGRRPGFGVGIGKTKGKRVALLLVFLLAGMAAVAAAQSRGPAPGRLPRTLAAELAGGSGITVRVVPLPGSAPVIGSGTGQGTLELGNASYASERRGAVVIHKHPDYFAITTQFGLELEPVTGTTAGAATLSAYLVDPSPNCRYYLDGVRLTSAVQAISLQLRYGTVSTHRLEIRVPVTAPAGPLQDSIGWVVSSSEVPNGLS